MKIRKKSRQWFGGLFNPDKGGVPLTTLLLFLVTGFFLAAPRLPGVLPALIVVGAAAALVLDANTHRVSVKLRAGFLAIALLFVVQLLPLGHQSWLIELLTVSDWRTLLGAGGLAPSWSLSPQPLMTLDHFGGFVIAVCLVYAYGKSFLTDALCRKGMWVICFFSAVVGFLLILCLQGKGLLVTQVMEYYASSESVPMVLAAGAILSLFLMLNLMTQGSLLGGLALLYFGFSFMGIFVSGSMVALLCFFAGFITWYGLSLANGQLKKLSVFGVPALVAGLGILSVALNRIGSGKGFGLDESLLTPQESASWQLLWRMVMDNPWIGAGSGCLGEVIGRYRTAEIDASLAGTEPVFGDLGRWIGEFGFPGLVCMAAFVAILMGLPLLRLHSRVPSQRAAALATLFSVLLFACFHSVITEPGIVALLLFLFRSCQANAPQGELLPDTPPLPLVKQVPLRLLGACGLMIGGVHLLSELGWVAWTSNTALAQSEGVIRASASTSDLKGVKKGIENALAWKPLKWVYYSQLGSYALEIGRDEALATQAFQQARELEPILAYPLFLEGAAWLASDRSKAVAAWEAAIRERISDRNLLYKAMVERGLQYPFFKPHLSKLASINPDFRSVYLQQIPIEWFQTELRMDLKKDPALKAFTSKQRVDIMKRWTKVDDVQSMVLYLQENGKGFPENAYFAALASAGVDDYEKAVQQLREQLSVPRVPEAVLNSRRTHEDLLRAWSASQNDLVGGLAVLFSQIERFDFDDALVTAEVLCREESPPEYALFWRGELKRLLGSSKGAWESWQNYVEQKVLKSNGS